MEKKTYLILFVIIVLAFGLRVFNLASNPPSLNWDEISHGYNAYSILKTGTDEWGQLPIFNFRAYGDYPTTLNMYLTIPFVAIFGLSEFAIRLPHVLLGVLTVISTFWLIYGISKRKDIALLTSLLIAVEPWTLFTSRVVLQSNLSIFLLITSVAFFVNRESSKKYLSYSLIALFLTLFSYHTTRIFSPLILLVSIFVFKNELFKKKYLVYCGLFFALSLFILLNPVARARAKYLSIFDQGAINKIETLQNKYGRIYVNKITYSMYTLGSNYIEYFSPNFLFLKGGTQYQFSIPDLGLSYPLHMPFFYIGLVLLIIKALKERETNYQFLLIWLLLAPIPASITNEHFAVLRATTMIPVVQILVAIGVLYVCNKISDKYKKYSVVLYAVILFMYAGGYLQILYTGYKEQFSQSWQYGYKEVAEYIKENDDKYAKIVMTKKYGEPHEFLLFYMKYDPKSYKNDKNLNRFNQSNWWWVDGFDKYYFVNDWQVPKEGFKFVQESKKIVDCKQAKCLFVASPNNAPKDWIKVKTINFLDGSPAFELYENN